MWVAAFSAQPKGMANRWRTIPLLRFAPQKAATHFRLNRYSAAAAQRAVFCCDWYKCDNHGRITAIAAITIAAVKAAGRISLAMIFGREVWKYAADSGRHK